MPSVKRDNSYIFLDPDKFKIERTIEKFRFSTKHTHTSASAHTHYKILFLEKHPNSRVPWAIKTEETETETG